GPGRGDCLFALARAGGCVRGEGSVKFGKVPIAEADGAILAHSVIAGGRRLKKAHRLTAEDIAILGEAGIAEVVVARLGADDVGEDEAAAAIAAALKTENVEA